MNIRYLADFTFALAASVSGLFAFVVPAAGAEGAKQNSPISKFYVVETVGESNVDNGHKIESLTKKSVFSAEGTVIETKAGATDAIVLSNGCALFVGPDTRFEVKKFSQEPFGVQRDDLDVEPSVSQTLVNVLHGSVGICTSKLVPGSSMVYTTAQSTINIRGRRLLVVAEEAETRVYLLEGDVTVIGSGASAGAGQVLEPNEFATIKQTGAERATSTVVQPIPENLVSQIDDRIANACISRRTVYFESTGGDGDNAPGELKPVEMVPAKLPTEYTISPSRL